MRRRTAVHWLAFGIIGIVALIVTVLIVCLMWIILGGLVHHWRGSIQTFVCIGFIAAGTWAGNYVQDHGWPWRPKAT
jgi:hypothetical protein